MRVRLFLLLTVLELGVLGFMAGQREGVLRYGRTVTLRTEPVDPSDPLRGEYARLGYSFSSVRRSQWQGGLAERVKAAGPSRRRLVDLRVYALLQDDGSGLAEFTGLSDRPPASGLYLAGRVDRATEDDLQVRYGIEAMFMEQGAARALEAARSGAHAGATLDVDVAIGNSGLAVLKGYAWEPLGITVTFERPAAPAITGRSAPAKPRPVRAAPAGPNRAIAVVTIVNHGTTDLAVVDVPEGGALLMVPDARRANGHPPYHWVGEASLPPDYVHARVVVLKPLQQLVTRVDLTLPRWFVTGPSVEGKAPAPLPLRDVRNVWNAWFRFEYLPPTASQSAGLPHADLIWHRPVSSRAFAAYGND